MPNFTPAEIEKIKKRISNVLEIYVEDIKDRNKMTNCIMGILKSAGAQALMNKLSATKNEEVWDKCARELCHFKSCTKYSSTCVSDNDVICDYLDTIRDIKNTISPYMEAQKLEAVEQERERIFKEFHKWANPKKCDSDFSELFSVSLKKLIPIIRQALSKQE